jgi:hypothetical protein
MRKRDTEWRRKQQKAGTLYLVVGFTLAIILRSTSHLGEDAALIIGLGISALGFTIWVMINVKDELYSKLKTYAEERYGDQGAKGRSK